MEYESNGSNLISIENLIRLLSLGMEIGVIEVNLCSPWVRNRIAFENKLLVVRSLNSFGKFSLPNMKRKFVVGCRNLNVLPLLLKPTDS